MLTYASSTVTSQFPMTCLWIDLPWTLGFKLFLVGHCGSLASKEKSIIPWEPPSIWIVIVTWWAWYVPYGPLCLCTHVCTLNLWIHVNSNISKSKCCKIWQIRSCTTTVGNSVILIWLLLVPACISILYHIPSPLTFTWGLGFPNGVPKPCGEDITNGGTGGIAFNLLKRSVYNWTSKVCQWYYWWFRNPARKPPGMYIYIYNPINNGEKLTNQPTSTG